MPTKLLLTAVAAFLAVSFGVIEAGEPEPAEAGPGITAEVRGTLRHEKGGHIYSIAVPSDVKGGQETRVWLMRGEDKDRELDRKLAGLDGKEVVAKGRLAQMPKDSHATVPPLGLYLGGRWSVEAAKAK
ncbi:MAG TPA: hypothetical protein VKS79_20420 [Gemmataceae bacterium]|nr:hypothetical protein [Gemmataceae bacterium]